tara:strand:- start:10912 stop:11046 length:135 start_codon:yes stop_codon:yes gene_type:complete
MNKKVIGQTELNGFVMATRVADRGIIDANTANEKSNNNTFRIKI